MNRHRIRQSAVGALLACAALHLSAADPSGQTGSLLDKLRSAVVPGSTAVPAAAPSTTPAPAAPATVQVGRKQVALSSKVIDAHCERVVDPFELNANLAALAAIAAAGATEGLGSMLASSTAKAEGHKLSRKVREQAMLLNWLPMSLEQRYGRLIHEDAVAAGVLVDRNSNAGKRLYPKADALLALVLSGVTEAHPYTFELHIRGADEDNAMALPGGIVYIDAGLLREGDSAKARFALAHEISHVLRRHETRIAQARLVDTISLSGATSELVKGLRDPTAISAGVLKAAAAGHKTFRQHYGDQEMQADSCAVRVLSAALPIDEVDASVQSFMAILPPDALAGTGSTGSAAGPAALGDLVIEVSRPVDRHPTSQERIDNLKAVGAEVKGLAPQSRTASGK